MKSTWITHKGKRLFYGRYDHLTFHQAREEIAEVDNEFGRQPPQSVLLLVEAAGTLLSPETLNMIKNHALRSQKYVVKTAVLGMSGARRVFLEIVAKFSGVKVEGFDDIEKAKDWLVS
jgi:hypothetical protein